MDRLLINCGVLGLIISLTALGVYNASFNDRLREWYFASAIPVFVLGIIFVAYDEFCGNILGKLKPETMRAIGMGISISLVFVSYLIGTAINWTFVVRFIQISFLVLVILIILGFIIFLLIKSRGNKNG